MQRRMVLVEGTRMTWPAKVARAIESRSGGLCEGCGEAPATEKHHRKYKSRGGKDVLSNALHLCGWGNHSGCHGRAHSDDPPEGWSVHSWEEPRLEPVRLHVGRVVLLDHEPWIAEAF